jgi:hypothetical protein
MLERTRTRRFSNIQINEMYHKVEISKKYDELVDSVYCLHIYTS